MTRIRYEKIGELLVSKPVFTGRTNLVVNIFLNPPGFCLIDDKIVIEEGKGRNLPEVKRNVKKALVTHGVSFEDEVRTKKIKI